MSVTGSWASAGGRFAVLVHGGAGDVPDARVERHVGGCRAAAARAREILVAGGSSLDAAQAAVVVLEDDPVFNAGTGACLSADGSLELDACLMEGEALRAGAVCVLSPFKNPIAIARAVLEDGMHVLYAAEGARAFAERAGFSPADPASMITEAAREKLAEARVSGKVSGWAGGTVGAVARDVHGHVAAATSTGGMAGKRAGRVGDSPLVGGGTYADDLGGAASATGHGEGILRVVLSATAVAALARARSPEEVAREVIAGMLKRVGSTGGLILVGRDGRLGWARSTRTMTWASEVGRRLGGRRVKRRSSARGVVGGRRRGLGQGALALQGLLQANAQALAAGETLLLQRGGQPLVAATHVPDCTVGHG